MRSLSIILTSLFLVFSGPTSGQKKDNAAITAMVEGFKVDTRGPYRDIRWFCKDGTTVGPQERCPQAGVQRARYKADVIALGKSNHIFLGQILSTTPNKGFWDEENEHSRLKQYQLERFLKLNDNGWVNRNAQFYRGATQAEDEEAWGIAFYKWLLAEEERSCSTYFLIRQSAKDIPHAAADNLAQSIRALSRDISDQFNGFMPLRVKIHGQPEKDDLQKVKDFQAANQERLSEAQNKKIEQLILEMEQLYTLKDINELNKYASKLTAGSAAHTALDALIKNYAGETTPEHRARMIARTALSLRNGLKEESKDLARLNLIDASIELETLLQQVAAEWHPERLDDRVSKVHVLAAAAAGFGYLEEWEWQELRKTLMVPADEHISLKHLGDLVENARRSVEWGTGMVRATYQDVVQLYTDFEPLANGFVDDKVRGSILLELGSSASQLGDLYSTQAGFSNSVMGLADQSSMRGLNPGYAKGLLVVTDRSPEEIEVDADKIYVFDRPPADLKPVAGIATVTEGNMVSHVQLLARNLGIPNAVLSKDNLNALVAHNGKEVFYAVSNKGTVIMKTAAQMSEVEAALFSKKARNEEKIRVPIEGMQLNSPVVLDMRDVDASSSGRICGPKAANLGQLKRMYPEHVVEGLVIPFSIFRQHFDQAMPAQGMSYWQFLKGTFDEAEKMRTTGSSESNIETYVLDRLKVLREAIKDMPLKPEFKTELQAKFLTVLKADMGKVPVFLRSDTNMEDLKDFTGAGLNLTLFNVLEADKIWHGIKDVWASPYTERSYRWRQHYLLDPENVFPSILIIPSVNAEKSGVMITKGVSTGNVDDVTVAFNKGVGGAVEGQASESWSLQSDGSMQLLSPAREPEYTSIPVTGGTKKVGTAFEDRLLTETDLKALRDMAERLKKDLGKLGINGPYDVELGFKNDHIWLFQVRPFVENKRASASDYLRSITPITDGSKMIPINTKLQ